MDKRERIYIESNSHKQADRKLFWNIYRLDPHQHRSNIEIGQVDGLLDILGYTQDETE